MLLTEIHESPLTLKGVGPSFIEALKKIGIQTIGDLLQLYPKDWEDRSIFNYLGDYNKTKKIRVKAIVLSHSWIGLGAKRTLKITIADDLSNKATLVCFNRNFLQNTYPIKSKVIVTGVFYKYRNNITSSSFELEKEGSEYKGILPIYPIIEGISNKKLFSVIKQALNEYIEKIDSDLPKTVISSYNLIEKSNVLLSMHSPKNMDDVEKARYTLIFEELFFFQYTAIIRYVKRRNTLPKEMDFLTFSYLQNNIKLSTLQKHLIKRLAFALTDDQIKATLEINRDLESNIPCSRLIQGDVGSGKTLVSFLAATYAIEKKWQVAFLAPTELLGMQHAEKAAFLLQPLGINIAFLSGNVKTKERNILLKQLENGNINLIIGTHAIFSENVKYKNLKLVIIDEQQKFGVLQREALLKKGIQNENILPHLIMMSATPIPRSLALSIFGDTDISTIKTMPNGRLPIKTYIAKSEKAQSVYDFVKNELKKGRQAYFIYPLIEESDTLKFKAVEKMKQELSIYFKDFKVSSITSNTEEENQKHIMQAFIEGKINILVATSIIEVGVDVPNASCIVIEDAQNFPLTTLHQMRGRVGRGNIQSYCILIYENHLTKNAYKRLKIMKETTDGFKIAEEDLKIRGPGDIIGTEQSGYLGFKFANPQKDYYILLKAREAAINYISTEMKQTHNSNI